MSPSAGQAATRSGRGRHTTGPAATHPAWSPAARPACGRRATRREAAQMGQRLRRRAPSVRWVWAAPAAPARTAQTSAASPGTRTAHTPARHRARPTTKNAEQKQKNDRDERHRRLQAQLRFEAHGIRCASFRGVLSPLRGTWPPSSPTRRGPFSLRYRPQLFGLVGERRR